MDSRGDAPIARWSTCLDSHAYLYPYSNLVWNGLSDARSVHGCLGLPLNWCMFVISPVCAYACAEVGLCVQSMWLYPTCTGAIVRSPVYTADHEVGWQPGFIYTLLPVITLHAYILL